MQALEQVRNNQASICSQECEPKSSKRPTEMWSMKTRARDDSSYNNSLVESDQSWKEEDAKYLTPSVSK